MAPNPTLGSWLDHVFETGLWAKSTPVTGSIKGVWARGLTVRGRVCVVNVHTGRNRKLFNGVDSAGPTGGRVKSESVGTDIGSDGWRDGCSTLQVSGRNRRGNSCSHVAADYSFVSRDRDVARGSTDTHRSRGFPVYSGAPTTVTTRRSFRSVSGRRWKNLNIPHVSPVTTLCCRCRRVCRRRAPFAFFSVDE